MSLVTAASQAASQGVFRGSLGQEQGVCQEVFRGSLGQEQGVWQGEVQGESCHGILGQEGEQHHSRNWVLQVQGWQHGH